MRHSTRPSIAVLALATLTCTLAGASAQQAPPAPSAVAPPSIVLTVVDKKGHPVTDLTAANVIVTAGKTQIPVKALVPLQGTEARMELYLLFDDDVPNFAPYMTQVRDFVKNLPNTTVVGVAYMHTGGSTIGIPLNLNRAGVAQGMRAPSGQNGVSQSPFESITDLIKGWQVRANRRRELVVVSSGVEAFQENTSDNSIVRNAVAAAQSSGIVVYAIAASGAGNSTAAPTGLPVSGGKGAMLGSTMNDEPPGLDTSAGQGHLADLAAGTGGAIYSQGLGSASGASGLSLNSSSKGSFMQNTGTPQNLSDTFDDISARMLGQFRVELDGAGRPAGLTAIKVEVRQPNVKISAPTAVVFP